MTQDNDTWQKGVYLLKHNKITSYENNDCKQKKSTHTEQIVYQNIVSDVLDLPMREVITDNTTHINPAIIKKIKKGQVKITARLDLHSLTLQQAYTDLLTFIYHNYRINNRLLLVITGKGKNEQGKIKNSLHSWLNNPELCSNLILYYGVACLKHGGSGAYYILLRKLKKLSKNIV